MTGADSQKEKFRSLLDAGMSWDEVIDSFDYYSKLNADEDMSATEQATDFALWVDQQGYSTDQAAAVKEQFKFWSMMPAQAKRYEDLSNVGLDAKNAHALSEALKALEPLEGAKSVSNLQRYRAVVDAGLSVEDQLTALGTIMGESEYAKVQTGYSFGVEPEAYVSFKELLPQYDADGNESYTQKEVETALDALGRLHPQDALMMGLRGEKVMQSMTLTNDQKAVLWQLQNKTWKPTSNPYSVSVGRKVHDALNAETYVGS